MKKYRVSDIQTYTISARTLRRWQAIYDELVWPPDPSLTPRGMFPEVFEVELKAYPVGTKFYMPSGKTYILAHTGNPMQYGLIGENGFWFRVKGQFLFFERSEKDGLNIRFSPERYGLKEVHK